MVLLLEWDSDSWAAYIDFETEITDKLTGAVAGRYENFEEYGTTLDWKGSATYHYNDTVLIDLEASYTFADHYTVTVGGQNIFDEYPDKEGDGTLQYLGDVYAVTSPFGFNGAFWYARLSASF